MKFLGCSTVGWNWWPWRIWRFQLTRNGPLVLNSACRWPRTSVAKAWARLFKHAVVHARNQGVSMIFIHALSENVAMLKIARHAGAKVQRDGSESEAYLSLPQATLDSQLSGIVQEQMAELDYQLKNQAHQFREWLSTVQEIRQGVRDARHTSHKP